MQKRQGILCFFDEGMEDKIQTLGDQIQSWEEVREVKYISAQGSMGIFKSE